MDCSFKNKFNNSGGQFSLWCLWLYTCNWHGLSAWNLGYVRLNYNYPSDLGTEVELNFLRQSKGSNSSGGTKFIRCLLILLPLLQYDGTWDKLTKYWTSKIITVAKSSQFINFGLWATICSQFLTCKFMTIFG